MPPAVILSGAGDKIAFSDLVEGDSPFKGKCREATKGLPPGYGPPMWGRYVAKKKAFPLVGKVSLRLSIEVSY